MSEKYIRAVFSGLPEPALEKLVAIDSLIPLVHEGEEQLPDETTRNPNVFQLAVDDWLEEAVNNKLIDAAEYNSLLFCVSRYCRLLRTLQTRDKKKKGNSMSALQRYTEFLLSIGLVQSDKNFPESLSDNEFLITTAKAEPGDNTNEFTMVWLGNGRGYSGFCSWLAFDTEGNYHHHGAIE